MNLANVSFIMNTDGVAIFHSSKVSLWPVWLAINELPPALRFSKCNMLLAGLWFAKAKPVMSSYLRPIVEEVNHLYSTGILVHTPDGMKLCQAMMLCTCLDLPAKATVTNMKQWNGENGCSVCLDKGDNTAGNSRSARYWPHRSNSIWRTHTGIIEDAKQSVHNNQPVSIFE